MKFTCNTEKLNQSIMNVLLAVSPKSTLVALEGILIKASSEGKIDLSGYNLEMGITTNLEAKVDEEGSIVIPAKIFSDIIKRMTSETVEIKSNNKQMIEISGGVANFNISGTASFEFPELPSVENGDTMSLEQNKLRSMIEQTIFAVAVKDAKPVHTGCLFNESNGELTVVAVDGFRLALRKEKTNGTGNHRFVVPGKNLSELLKLLDTDEGMIEITVSSKHIMFNIKNTILISRLLEGDFLDYEAAIPKNAATKVNVSTRTMLSSIERTSLIISDRLKSPLRLLFEDSGIIKMSCSTSMGKAYDECACEFEGNNVEIGFNNGYLIDALRNSQSDMVKLEIGGPLSPMKVVPIEGESFLFLVLPMKLKSE